MDTGAGEAGPVQLPSGEQVVTQHVALPPRVLQLLKEHTAFLHHQGDPPPSPAPALAPPPPPPHICLLKTRSRVNIKTQKMSQP